MAENLDLRDENILTVDDVLKYKLLGQGNTAEIFLYTDVTVLKLFRDGFPQSGIMKEWNVTRAVQKGLRAYAESTPPCPMRRKSRYPVRTG